MSFIQDIYTALRFTRYLNTGGQYLSTDDTGLVVLVDLPTSPPVLVTHVFTAASLVEESYGGVWYLPIDNEGRSLVSISVTRSDTSVTKYMDVSAAETDPAFTPNTRISGFDSADPQLIVIKLA